MEWAIKKKIIVTPILNLSRIFIKLSTLNCGVLMDTLKLQHKFFCLNELQQIHVHI